MAALRQYARPTDSARQPQPYLLPPIEEEAPRSPQLPALDLPHRNAKKYKTYDYIFIDDDDDVERKQKMLRIRDKQRTVHERILDKQRSVNESLQQASPRPGPGPSPRREPHALLPLENKKQAPEDDRLNRIINAYLGQVTDERHEAEASGSTACPCCTERNSQNLYLQRQLHGDLSGARPQESRLPDPNLVPGFHAPLPYTDDGLDILKHQARGYPAPYPVGTGEPPRGPRDAHYPHMQFMDPLNPDLEDAHLKESVYLSSRAYEDAMGRLQQVSRSYRH